MGASVTDQSFLDDWTEPELFERGMRLGEARKVLLANLDGGLVCPCCGQYARRYRRKLNSGMARTLIYIYKEFLRNGRVAGWLQVKDFLRENKYRNTHDWTLLKYWGLLALSDEESVPEQKHTGMYRITKKGILFVEGKVQVQTYLVMYNNAVEEFSGALIGIQQSLQAPFDYSELMAEAEGGKS